MMFVVPKATYVVGVAYTFTRCRVFTLLYIIARKLTIFVCLESSIEEVRIPNQTLQIHFPRLLRLTTGKMGFSISISLALSENN